MVLSKGFPPSDLISPSVRIAEKDLSFIAPEQTGHRSGIVGFASKGPINVPTLITSVRQLHTIFGQAHPDIGDPYLIYAAEQYLQVGTELFVVRVAEISPVSDDAAGTASIEVLTAGGAVQIVGNVSVGSGWVFADDVFFRWRLNGVLASKILVVLAGTYTSDELVDSLNDQLSTSIDGIEFYESGSGSSIKLGVQTTFAYGSDASLELVSVTDALYGPSSVVGMGTGMVAASVTGTAVQYPASSVPNVSHYNFSSFEAGVLNLEIVIDGTDNVLVDNVVQVVTIPSSNYTNLNSIVTVINTAITNGDIPGGFVASQVSSTGKLKLTTLHTGRDAKLVVKSSSTADTLFGLSTSTNFGTSPSGVTAAGATYNLAIVAGSDNSTSELCFTVEADSPGVDGNNTEIVITNHISDGEFTVDVYSYGNQVETWGNLTKDPTSTFYVESYVSLVSDYIRVTDNTDTLALPTPSTLSSPYALSGGSDGIPADPSDQDSLLIGSLTAMTGLQSMSDPEQIDIDLIVCPGHTSTDIVAALLTFCQSTRGDCFSIIDSPFGLTVKEVVQWQNGVHPLNDARFDSDFGALYWPWVKIRDTFNRINVWVPPSTVVLGTYANSDSIGAPWYAPAGLNRGFVSNVLDVFSRPSLDERDAMYQSRNAVNPIIQFSDVDGFYIWGQKTLQRRPTALDRVNVRRMLLWVEKRIKSISRRLLFEPNDSELRSEFTRLASGVLSTVQNERGLIAFIVQCDQTLNTSDVIDRNELRARIGIQPTKAVEFIFIEFSLHRTGSFGESADTF